MNRDGVLTSVEGLPADVAIVRDRAALELEQRAELEQAQKEALIARAAFAEASAIAAAARRQTLRRLEQRGQAQVKPKPAGTAKRRAKAKASRKARKKARR